MIYNLGRDGAFELDGGAERRAAPYELRPLAEGEAVAKDSAEAPLAVPSAGL